MDLLSLLYVLFSHFRQRNGTPENCFFQKFKCCLMLVHPNAFVCIINEKTRGKISWRTSGGLNWENKIYKLKRSIISGNRNRFPRILTKKVMGEGRGHLFEESPFFCYFGQGLGAYSRKGVHLLEHAYLFQLIRYNVCSSEN